jgi:hypothetical protein
MNSKRNSIVPVCQRLSAALAFSLSVVALTPLPAGADPTFSDANWISTGGIAGADNIVRATAVDSWGNLYIGGEFTMVGDVFANHIAKWDGRKWTALGSGIAGDSAVVYALAVSGSNVFAAGNFTNAGGTAVNCIAKWNGSGWSGLGSGMAGAEPYEGGPLVCALAVSGSNLYVGGVFTSAGGVAATNIAKWNGSSWSALGSGVSGGANYLSVVFALAVSGSDVYVGGSFANPDGSAATNIAKWNGSSWSALGLGMETYNYVRALAVSGSDLYVGGFFGKAGGIPAVCIAKWNGSNWSPLGSGLGMVYPPPYDLVVRALAVSGNNVYVGGGFTTAGGIAATNIAKWNGSSWSALDSGIEYGGDHAAYVYALAMSGTNVNVGGEFTTAGSSPASFIANWNGSRWSGLGAGIDSYPHGVTFVQAMATSGSNVYAGGSFTAASSSPATNIAKWTQSGWTALGSGISAPNFSPYYGGQVLALAVSGTIVYAGGLFTAAGGSPATNIAKWNGSSWSKLGSGINGDVSALAVSGNNLYAGGSFTKAGTTTATNIAKWNGSSWSKLGSGINGGNGSVAALVVSGNDLYAGGWFTTAGGMPATNIAKWNGTSWSALGSGMNGAVIALTMWGSNLYAGGWFTTADGNPATNIAKWDGNNWSAIASEMNYGVSALAVSGDNLYAGGRFDRVSGIHVNFIAKWDRTNWSAMGSGMNANVNALAVLGSDLYVGGAFTTAGGKVSAYVARAYLPTLPTLSVLRSGANVIVAWPSPDTTGFDLEQTGALLPANWIATAASVTDDGTNKWVRLPAANSAQYFRLRRP